ncbi:MAG TPA: MMPL family transporter, partial [Enhygromyxa sp.]|nr:MMPL family transporter [Enhygromyxa sp.]
LASRRVDTQLGGVLGLEFELVAPTGVDLRDPALLARMHGFERWLAEQPQVRAVEGLATIVASTGQLLGDEAIPNDRATIDARLAMLGQLAPLDRYLRDDGRFVRIHAGLPDAGGRDFVEFAARAEAELERRLQGTGIHADATGTPLLAYQGVNRITSDLRSSFALVFVIVIATIGLLFRSIWPALVAVLPNGIPLALGYAMIGLFGTVLDPLAAVILTLALGIAVDDTLHIMVRTREELRRGVGVEVALREAIDHSGRAVAVTSVVIAGGLALNLLSSFPPLQVLGLLGTVVITLALLADLLVLPALLVILRGRGLGR